MLLDAVAAEPEIQRRFGTEVIHASPDGEVTMRTEPPNPPCAPTWSSALTA